MKASEISTTDFLNKMHRIESSSSKLKVGERQFQAYKLQLENPALTKRLRNEIPQSIRLPDYMDRLKAVKENVASSKVVHRTQNRG